jgi:hypothetical protein
VIVSPSPMDTPWRVAGTLGTAFYRDTGFTLLIQYFRTNSSGSNYSLQDFVVAAGPTFHFRPLGHS